MPPVAIWRRLTSKAGGFEPEKDGSNPLVGAPRLKGHTCLKHLGQIVKNHCKLDEKTCFKPPARTVAVQVPLIITVGTQLWKQ